MENDELIRKAKEPIEPKFVSDGVNLGEVGSALVTKKGNIYVGVSIDTPCGIGFCAEHTAIGAMITNREYEIEKIVAVSSDGKVLAPCGRCRELMYQVNKANLDTEIVLGGDRTAKLKELLPEK